MHVTYTNKSSIKLSQRVLSITTETLNPQIKMNTGFWKPSFVPLNPHLRALSLSLRSTQGSSFPPASFSLFPPASRVLLPFKSTYRGANKSTFLSAIISSSNYLQIYMTGGNIPTAVALDKKDYFGFSYLRSVPATFSH